MNMKDQLTIYKLCIKKDSTYYCSFSECERMVMKDHWTTIKLVGDNLSDGVVKYFGKANLMKQIAKQELGNIRLWKKIELDNYDIEVMR